LVKFVIDEDLPRSLGGKLKAERYLIFDVRDFGLRGKKDQEIFNFAQSNTATLITGDLGFGNLLKFPLGKHFGIIIIHYPNDMSKKKINKHVLIGRNSKSVKRLINLLK
jgi:predicted nuclease of predicted toxin-antitoxin system